MSVYYFIAGVTVILSGFYPASRRHYGWCRSPSEGADLRIGGGCPKHRGPSTVPDTIATPQICVSNPLENLRMGQSVPPDGERHRTVTTIVPSSVVSPATSPASPTAASTAARTESGESVAGSGVMLSTVIRKLVEMLNVILTSYLRTEAHGWDNSMNVSEYRNTGCDP